jgi:hypothetical protein
MRSEITYVAPAIAKSTVFAFVNMDTQQMNMLVAKTMTASLAVRP